MAIAIVALVVALVLAGWLCDQIGPRCTRCERPCGARMAGGTVDRPVCVLCVERERRDPATCVNRLPDARAAALRDV